MSQTPQAPARPATTELYVKVQQFYAHQMPLLEENRIEEYVRTFTEDGVFEHQPDGWRLEGRHQIAEGARKNIPRYAGNVFRHWFDKLRVEVVDDSTVRTTFSALVSVTDPRGQVTFEPTSTVRDVLERRGGVLLTRSRTMIHDVAQTSDVWDGVLER